MNFNLGNLSKRRHYKATSPSVCDTDGEHMDEDNDHVSIVSKASTRSNRSKASSKRSKKSVDDDEDMDDADYYPELDPGDLSLTKSIRVRKAKMKESEDAMELRLRTKPVAGRLKFDSSIKWDGTYSTFKIFSQAVIGHLMMAGASYMTKREFIVAYLEYGENYLSSDEFWKTYRISIPQAKFDKSYFFGLLYSATKTQQHKTLMKFKEEEDGILAWDELTEDYEHGGSRDLRLEQLADMANKPYSPKTSGGISSYIDKFQVIVQELQSIAPDQYGDELLKRMLLTNIRPASRVDHLIQHCVDHVYLNYNASAAYLRKNAILIDYRNQYKAPSRLMHVEQDF